MQLNFLQLNKDKKEIIIFGNEERMKVIAQLDSKAKKTKTQVRNLRSELLQPRQGDNYIHILLFQTNSCLKCVHLIIFFGIEVIVVLLYWTALY